MTAESARGAEEEEEEEAVVDGRGAESSAGSSGGEEENEERRSDLTVRPVVVQSASESEVEFARRKGESGVVEEASGSRRIAISNSVAPAPNPKDSALGVRSAREPQNDNGAPENRARIDHVEEEHEGADAGPSMGHAFQNGSQESPLSIRQNSPANSELELEPRPGGVKAPIGTAVDQPTPDPGASSSMARPSSVHRAPLRERPHSTYTIWPEASSFQASSSYTNSPFYVAFEGRGYQRENRSSNPLTRVSEVVRGRSGSRPRRPSESLDRFIDGEHVDGEPSQKSKLSRTASTFKAATGTIRGSLSRTKRALSKVNQGDQSGEGPERSGSTVSLTSTYSTSSNSAPLSSFTFSGEPSSYFATAAPSASRLQQQKVKSHLRAISSAHFHLHHPDASSSSSASPGHRFLSRVTSFRRPSTSATMVPPSPRPETSGDDASSIYSQASMAPTGFQRGPFVASSADAYNQQYPAPREAYPLAAPAQNVLPNTVSNPAVNVPVGGGAARAAAAAQNMQQQRHQQQQQQQQSGHAYDLHMQMDEDALIAAAAAGMSGGPSAEGDSGEQQEEQPVSPGHLEHLSMYREFYTRRGQVQKDTESGVFLPDSAEAVAGENAPAVKYDPARRLPTELFADILGILDASSLAKCEAVSRSWRAVAGSRQVWRVVFLRKYRLRVHLDPAPLHVGGVGAGVVTPTKNFKQMYRARVQIEDNWQRGENGCRAIYFNGHTDSVYCCQFDEKKLITGSRDRTIRIWDMETSRCIKVIGGPQFMPKTQPTALPVHPSATVLSVNAENGTKYGESIFHTPEYYHTASILCLQYDEEIMVTGSSDSTCIVWDIRDVNNIQPIHQLVRHTGGVLDVAFDSRYIVSCSKDQQICVWERATGALVRVLTGHTGPVNAVQLRGNHLVSASGDGVARLWSMTTFQAIRDFASRDRGLAAVEFSDDAAHILAGGNDNCIYRFDVGTGELEHTYDGHSMLVRSLFLDSANGRVVSGSYDQSIRVYDFASGRHMA
ncbi:hypothetical protein BDY21DRAFT_415945, partial [Lineolata rhizophorae]